MKKYNISSNLIRVIKILYDKATSAVPLQQHLRRLVPNNSWSPTGMSTLTHSLKHISGMDHDRRSRIITNLRLADDIDGLMA